jgi:hypothetical protein
MVDDVVDYLGLHEQPKERVNLTEILVLLRNTCLIETQIFELPLRCRGY